MDGAGYPEVRVAKSLKLSDLLRLTRSKVEVASESLSYSEDPHILSRRKDRRQH